MGSGLKKRLGEATKKGAEKLDDEVKKAFAKQDALAVEGQHVDASPNNIQAFKYAMQQNGGTAQDASKSLTAFAQKLREQEGFVKSVEALKVKVTQKNGQLRDLVSVLIELEPRLAKEPIQKASTDAKRLGLNPNVLSAMRQARFSSDYKDYLSMQRDMGGDQNVSSRNVHAFNRELNQLKSYKDMALAKIVGDMSKFGASGLHSVNQAVVDGLHVFHRLAPKTRQTVWHGIEAGTVTALLYGPLKTLSTVWKAIKGTRLGPKGFPRAKTVAVPRIRSAAARALQKVGPIIERGLKSVRSSVVPRIRSAAARALQKAGPIIVRGLKSTGAATLRGLESLRPVASRLLQQVPRLTEGGLALASSGVSRVGARLLSLAPALETLEAGISMASLSGLALLFFSEGLDPGEDERNRPMLLAAIRAQAKQAALKAGGQRSRVARHALQKVLPKLHRSANGHVLGGERRSQQPLALQQTTHITVNAASDPHKTAQAVKSVQKEVHRNAARHFATCCQ